MNRVTYGLKVRAPLYGRGVVNMFSNHNSENLMNLGDVSMQEDMHELLQELLTFLRKGLMYDPFICFMDEDPLDNPLNVELVLKELNKCNLVFSVYIETHGKDQSGFLKLISHQIDHIGINIVIPNSLKSNHTHVQSAFECLRLLIESEENNDSDRSLILTIKEDSNLEVLREYFTVVREAFGSALSAFDIIIRPECNNLEKMFKTRSILKDDICLSQSIVIGSFNRSIGSFNRSNGKLK